MSETAQIEQAQRYLTFLARTPLGYYRYLRKQGFRPRMAAVLTFMKYCPSTADFGRRIQRWPRDAKWSR